MSLAPIQMVRRKVYVLAFTVLIKQRNATITNDINNADNKCQQLRGGGSVVTVVNGVTVTVSDDDDDVSNDTLLVTALVVTDCDNVTVSYVLAVRVVLLPVLSAAVDCELVTCGCGAPTLEVT